MGCMHWARSMVLLEIFPIFLAGKGWEAAMPPQLCLGCRQCSGPHSSQCVWLGQHVPWSCWCCAPPVCVCRGPFRLWITELPINCFPLIPVPLICTQEHLLPSLLWRSTGGTKLLTALALHCPGMLCQTQTWLQKRALEDKAPVAQILLLPEHPSKHGHAGVAGARAQHSLSKWSWGLLGFMPVNREGGRQIKAGGTSCIAKCGDSGSLCCCCVLDREHLKGWMWHSSTAGTP